MINLSWKNLVVLLGLAAGVAMLTGTKIQAWAEEKHPLIGTWVVFDYAEEPVVIYDLTVTAVKGDKVTFKVNNSEGIGTYKADKKELSFGIGKRKYKGDLKLNKADKWVLNGVSVDPVSDRIDATANFKASKK